jgi:hypothetical protein
LPFADAPAAHNSTAPITRFAISAAKNINRAAGRKRGTVFAYRYHATAITNPSQARKALSYVLNN